MGDVMLLESKGHISHISSCSFTAPLIPINMARWPSTALLLFTLIAVYQIAFNYLKSVDG